MDYPLGWPIIPAALVRRQYGLTGGATATVGVGDQVRADQVVAERPGPNGERVPILSGIAGRVSQLAPGRSLTVEGPATVVQGLVGLGGVTAGPLHFLPRGESLAVVPLPPGVIIVFPGRLPLTLLQRAAAGQVAGIIAGSVAARELEAFTRTDMTAALDGLVPDLARLPLTLVFTEGIGSFAMDLVVFQMLAQRAGEVALLNGATNPHRNARPELLLPLPPGTKTVSPPLDDTIALGARIRMIAGPKRGARGEVVHLFEHQQHVDPGLLVAAARVRLEDGSGAVVPVGFLERVG
ncbi:MAG TPA: hypothetical protein VIC85_05155 [Ktedonobacterales bacterium]|jgi:hypothetical protein